MVLGAHILGPDAGEMAQLLGIPLKAGLTKDDFDRTMAVHPTAAEELVTMYKPTYRVKDGERVAREHSIRRTPGSIAYASSCSAGFRGSG